MMQSLTKRMREWMVPASAGPAVRISGARAKELVHAGAKLVDVRTEMEHAAGHVAGSVNIPVSALRARIGELGSPDVPIVLYCRSGARSGRGARMLRELGYGQAYDMGPATAWPEAK